MENEKELYTKYSKLFKSYSYEERSEWGDKEILTESEFKIAYKRLYSDDCNKTISSIIEKQKIKLIQEEFDMYHDDLWEK